MFLYVPTGWRAFACDCGSHSEKIPGRIVDKMPQALKLQQWAEVDRAYDDYKRQKKARSEAYNHKKKVRDLRELERDLHNHAIQVYKDTLGPDTALEGSGTKSKEAAFEVPRQTLAAIDELFAAQNSASVTAEKGKGQVNRNIIKRIKKELVFKDSKYYR